MKFFNILALVAFASAAPTIKDVEERSLCLEDRSTGIEEFHSGVEQRSPGIEEIHSDIEERQSGGAADSITAALAELTRVVNISVEAIRAAIEQSKGAVSAEVLVQIQGVIRANFRQIANAFRFAGETILRATTGSGQNLQAIIEGLSREQLDNIRRALTSAISLITNIGITFTAALIGVRPAIQNLVVAELAALESAVEPFLTPLRTFVLEIQRIRGEATVGVTGLAGVVQELGRIVQGLVAGLGLPSLNVPTNGGLGGVLQAVTGLVSLGRPTY